MTLLLFGRWHSTTSVSVEVDSLQTFLVGAFGGLHTTVVVTGAQGAGGHATTVLVGAQTEVV